MLDNLDESGKYVLSRDSFAPRDRHQTSVQTPNQSNDNIEAQLKQLTTEWLSRALQTGQVGRVVAPLFAALLHPNTARTSLVGLRERRIAETRTEARHNRRLVRQRERITGEKKSKKSSDVLRDSDGNFNPLN